MKHLSSSPSEYAQRILLSACILGLGEPLSTAEATARGTKGLAIAERHWISRMEMDGAAANAHWISSEHRN